MGWDVIVEGKECSISHNYTSNLSALLADHIPANSESGSQAGIRGLNGLTGKEAVKILAEAFEEINNTRIAFWDKNDDPGGDQKFVDHYQGEITYGSVVGTLLFLSNVLGACATMPDGKVIVC